MNKSIIEDTSKEKAFKMTGLLTEEAELAISRLQDISVLTELHMIYFQSNKDDLKRLVEKRITELGGVY